MTIYLPPNPEFRVLVQDRGIPNQERISIQAQTKVQMGSYCLLLAIRGTAINEYLPLNDKFFWFGTGILQPSEWVIVYTGPGKARKTNLQDKPETAFVLHWDQSTTVLADNSVSPLLMNLGSMTIADPPQMDLPQTDFSNVTG